MSSTTLLRIARHPLVGGTVIGTALLAGVVKLRTAYGEHFAPGDLLDTFTPIPLTPGGTTTPPEALVTHALTRTRTAANYDKFWDHLERKVGEHAMRQKLISTAQGHVLEVGVGTHRNLQFYDNTKVSSLTVVDQKYPLLNAALVKACDLLVNCGSRGLVVALNQQVPLECATTTTTTTTTTPAGAEQQEQEQEQQEQQQQQQQQQTQPQQPDQTPITTMRPQLLLPHSTCPELYHYLEDLIEQQPTYEATQLNERGKSTIVQLHEEPPTLHELPPAAAVAIYEAFPYFIFDLFAVPDQNFQKLPPPPVDEDADWVVDFAAQGIGTQLYDIETVHKVIEEVDKEYDWRNFIYPKLLEQRLATERGQRVERWERDLSTWTPLELHTRRERHLELGAKWLEEATDKNVLPQAFFHLDAENVNKMFPENTFDTVVDTFGLCCYEKPVEVVQHMARVCKPGGKMIFLERGATSSQPEMTEVKRQMLTMWGSDRMRNMADIFTQAGYDAKDLVFERGKNNTIFCATKPGGVVEQNNVPQLANIAIEETQSGAEKM